MTKKRPYGGLEPSMKYDSNQKRERKQGIRTAIIGTVILVLGLLIGMRLHKVVRCSEAGGFYQRTNCGDSRCCQQVGWERV